MLLAMDIGIKNLAYCLSDEKGVVQHWSIVNLTQEEEVPSCMTCQKPAKARTPQGPVCGRHVPKQALWVHDKKTSPTVAQLQAFLELHHLDHKGKKDVLLERANTIATSWLPKVKNVMTWANNTIRLHDAIRDWITRDWARLVHVRHVYIEHQPVLKNPVMKTVQLLIFASLRERYLSHALSCEIHFVHAGKKVQGETVGDAGYKDRKKKGEARVRTYLETFPPGSTSQQWLQWWSAQPKRDDLADALCMIMDHADMKK